MKKIGIIGGLGPESTILYYREIISQYQARSQKNTPVVLIHSINTREFFRLQESGDHGSQLLILQKAVESLAAAGANLIAMSANTPHEFFDLLASHCPVPMISIVEETARETLAISPSGRAGLFGTRYTMQGTFYKTTFAKHRLEVYAPEASDQESIHRIIYDELVRGVVSDSSKKQLESIIDRMICVYGIDTLILGCTELPLIISGEHKGVILLNTVNIHVRALVDFIL